MNERVARPHVAAVIVNYNAGDALALAVRSLANDQGVDWEAVVVDNASSDRSIEGLTRAWPWVRTICNLENYGFGRAVNQGVAETRAPFILLMNPDCELDRGATGHLLLALAADETVAVVGPRIFDPDGRPQGNARGDPDMLTGLFGRTSLLQRLLPAAATARRNVVAVAAGDGTTATDVDWLSGACVLVRRSAFERVGGFDERYFLYWEDADLCRRLRRAGYRIVYSPEATAVHQVGRSSRTARAASIRAFHRSAYLYYVSHVAPSPRDPKRAIAWALLHLRCWWKLTGSVRGPTDHHTEVR